MPNSLIQDELADSVVNLRGSLTELVSSVGGDPLRPQDVSRQFGIDKSLAWKVCRMVRATGPTEALPHLPGDAAFEILLRAMEKCGADELRLSRARAAIRRVSQAVEMHVGDRPTLEIVLDALPSSQKDRLSLSRKLAFRGNSGIWGVQARVRINTCLIAPNPDDPSMVDSALIGGWIDFRRMRGDARWVLFRRKSFRMNDITVRTERPIDPTSGGPDGPMFLRSFCSEPLPAIEAIQEDGSVLYELGPGPIGNAGTFTCFFASLNQKLGSRYADAGETHGEFFAMVSAPTESLQFDLIVHESLADFARQATPIVVGALTTKPSANTERDSLPVSPVVHDLGRNPPSFASPLVSNYSEVVGSVLENLNWNPKQFIGVRYTLEHPPFPSTLIVRFPLANRSTNA